MNICKGITNKSMKKNKYADNSNKYRFSKKFKILKLRINNYL